MDGTGSAPVPFAFPVTGSAHPIPGEVTAGWATITQVAPARTGSGTRNGI